MDGTKCSQPQGFNCRCTNIPVPKDQIIKHLEQNSRHVLTKASSTKSSFLDFEDFKISLAKKIESVLKIESDIQEASVIIIKAVTQNTYITIQNLEQLVKIYKEMLFEPPQINDSLLKQKDIVSTFSIKRELHNSLNEHFEQKVLTQKWPIERLVTNAKNKIEEIYATQCDTFTCMVTSSDERFIVTGGREGNICVWDLENKAKIFNLKKHKGPVRSIALGSGDEILLSGSSDFTVRLWNLLNRKQEFIFKGHTDVVNTVLLSNDNKTGYSGSWDYCVKIWDLDKKELKDSLKIVHMVSQIIFIDQERTLVTVGGWEGISFVDLNSRELNVIHNNGKETIRCVCFTKCEKYFVAGYANGKIQIWDTETQKVIFKVKKHTKCINKIVFSSDSKLFATCSSDKTFFIWDFKKKCTIDSVTKKSPIHYVCFLKNSFSFAFCSNAEIEFYKVITKETEIKISAHLLSLEIISISSDGKYLAIGKPTISLYNLESNKNIKEIRNSQLHCSYVKFSRDSSFLGCGHGSGEIYIFQVPCLTLIYKCHPVNTFINSLSFSSSNKYIGFEGNDQLIVMENGKTEFRFRDSLKDITAIEFCLNDEKFIYSVAPYTIHILDKYFNKEAVIDFKHSTSRLIAIGNNETIIVKGFSKSWSCVNLVTFNKVFQNKSSKEFKKWIANKEPKYISIERLSHIIIS